MNKILFLYPITLAFYSVYSFSQTAPNLVLSSNPIYWQFQQSMWQLGYHMRPLSTLFFVILMLLSFLSYFLVIHHVRKKNLTLKQVIILFSLCVVALLPSYPALSNDIYNYLMNAKMMHVYKASPYEHAAWDFKDEPWLSFMMNVHTVTPYGYVWTALGYITYILAFGDLQLGMLAFRLLAVAAVSLTGWGIWTSAPKKKLELLVYFLFNPLIFYEAINNTHNDIAMMGFFVGGVGLWHLLKHKSTLRSLFVLMLMWLLSVFTKLITVIAPGVFAFWYVVKHKFPQFNWADWLTFASVAIMYTDGSKRFFTWYLLWAFCVVPLAQSTFSKNIMIAFTVSGMLSYSFFLYSGEYTSYWGFLRIGLLFTVPLLYSIYYGLTHKHA